MVEEGVPAVIAGRFRVVGSVGSGGLGRVLEVEVASGRLYAAKVLKPAFRDDEELVRRMFREAQSAAAIRHPGIVGIHAVAHDAELGPVLVMERLYGDTLRTIAERRRLDAQQARWLALKVLDALGAAHRQGIVHRDVKPSNILVEHGTERVRLMDFGVAGVLQAPTLTLPGRFMGTLQFASPEQILNHTFSARSDLYSLGVTLLFAMTGQRVPNRDMVAERPPRALLGRLDLSPWWRTVLERALQPDPDARYQTAEEMAEAIRALPAEPLRPLLAPPDPPADPPPDPPSPASRRRRLWWGALGALVGCGTLLAAATVLVAGLALFLASRSGL